MKPKTGGEQWRLDTINIQFLRDNLCCFQCARERASEDFLWAHLELLEPARHSFDFAAPLFRQGTFVVGTVPLFPICLSVPQKIEFHFHSPVDNERARLYACCETMPSGS